MGKASHKPRPSIAEYNWWGLDGCWFCKNRNGCNSCKVMKEIHAAEVEKRNRQEKAQLQKEIKELDCGALF